jgi:hypothetical protein
MRTLHSKSRCRRAGTAHLEVFLALSIIVLLLQLFPNAIATILSAADLRNWSREALIIGNIGILLGLFSVRFASEFKGGMANFRKRLVRAASVAKEAPEDPEYEARKQRDAEWRQRAKKRLPHH